MELQQEQNHLRKQIGLYIVDISTYVLVMSCCKPIKWIVQDRPDQLDASQSSWFPSAFRGAAGLHVTTATLLLHTSDSPYCSSQTDLIFVCAQCVCVCVQAYT